MTTKNTQRIQLRNGCSCSQFSVFPSDWKEPGADIKKDWYIFYRFYDPEFRDNLKYKYGKLVHLRGMNEYKTLMARRQMTQHLLDTVHDLIVNKGYNPITKQYMSEPVSIRTGIPKDTPFIKALELALEKKVCDKAVKTCLRSVIKYVSIAARQLRFDQLPISEITRPHLLMIFEQLETVKNEKWTRNNYNHYRSHLNMLFKELILWCVIEINPVRNIPIMKDSSRKKREVLSEKDRKLIDETLRRDNFPFWLHINIFYLSGCRRVELLRVKGKDVDLENQRFSVERRKGKDYTIVDYTIPDIAVSLWKMALVGCGDDDYVFSVGLKPGKHMINPRQVTRRWRTWIKKKLGVTADYYSLKHLQTTEISKRHGIDVAAAFNNESSVMIKKHYDVEYENRLHEQKKRDNKPFL